MHRAVWVMFGLGWSTPVAWAVAPDKVAATYELSDRQIKRLTVSADRRLVAAASADGDLVLLDSDAWTTHVVVPCTSRAVAFGETSTDGVTPVYVGCMDGSVRGWRYDGETLEPDTDEDEAPTWSLDDDPIVGLWMGGDDRLYALVEPGESPLVLHSFDPNSSAAASTPIVFQRSDFREAAIGGTVSGAAGTLYVAHGSSDFTRVELPSGVPTPTLGFVNTVTEVQDVTIALGAGGVTAGVYVADADRGVFQWTGQVGGVGAVDVLPVDADLTNVRAMTVTSDASGALDGIVYQRAARIETVATWGTEPTVTVTGVDFEALDMVNGPAGYVFVGTEDGELVVLSDRPWLEEIAASPSAGETGTTYTLSFRTDVAGSYKVYVGGDRTGNGDEVGSGEVDAAGAVSVNLTVSEAYEEGANDLYVVFTDARGRVGHARARFAVDDAPERISLADGDVTFANRALRIGFDALTDGDLSEYLVYVSTTPFLPRDFRDGGGPEGEVDGGLISPVSLEARDDVDRVTGRLAPLRNGVTYFVAVRAVDASGTEGPMSNVVEGVPRVVVRPGERVGETGGSGCATGTGSGLGALVGAAALLLRRRNLAIAALFASVGLAVPAADAQESAPNERKEGLARFNRDITPAWGSFEFRHDFQQLQQEPLRDSYAPWVSVFRLETGPQFFRVLELDFGLGFMTRKGFLTDDEGNRSGDSVRMQWLPLSLGATARAHIIDEQPVVPYVGAGIDWVFYREDLGTVNDFKVFTANKASRLVGSKRGWHWSVGGNILLDLFDRDRAGRLEAVSGINDTWLTIEYRRQKIGADDSGFDFSGWALSVGLKMDF